MSNAFLNAMVAVAMAAAGLVAAFASTSKTNHTELGYLPAITVHADRYSVTEHGDIPDLIVVADRYGSIVEGVEISYSDATADLRDMTVTVPRDASTRVATADSNRSDS